MILVMLLIVHYYIFVCATGCPAALHASRFVDCPTFLALQHIVDLFSVRGWCTAAPQLTRVVWALLRALEQLKTQLHLLGSTTLP
jgi:hypothetical protein